MFVVVDALNDELRRSIEFLNEHADRYSIHALEVEYFHEDEHDVHILVRELYGASISSLQRTATGRGRWDENRFFADVTRRRAAGEVSDQSIELMRTLLRLAEEQGDRVEWGTGRDTGSYSLHFIYKNRAVSLYTVYSNAGIQINYGWMAPRIPAPLMQSLAERLRTNPEFAKHVIPADFRAWRTSALTETFPDRQYVDEFIVVALWLKQQLRNLESQQ